MTIRTLRDDEEFPQHLGTGFEAMPVMKAYCWVAEEDKRIVGILMGAPCHGLLYFVRIRVLDGAPVVTAAMLFRHAMRDAQKMGFKGYFSHIDPTRNHERALIPLCQKAGGFQVPMMSVPVVGAIDKAARF